MHKIIDECLRAGIKVSMTLENDKVLYWLEDCFYKSNGCTYLIIDTNNKVLAYSRYNQVDRIESFDDIVRLNYYWWMHSRNRFEGWKDPSPQFIKHFERLNLTINS